MAHDPDALSDARSREENRRHRDLAERGQSGDPAFAYAPRWVPMPRWRLSGFDLVVIVAGLGIILMVLGMRLFGVIGSPAG